MLRIVHLLCHIYSFAFIVIPAIMLVASVMFTTYDTPHHVTERFYVAMFAVVGPLLLIIHGINCLLFLRLYHRTAPCASFLSTYLTMTRFSIPFLCHHEIRRATTVSHLQTINKATRAYRSSVLPLSAFLILAGIVFPLGAWIFRVPITQPFPFVESESVNRSILGFCGILLATTGVGLLLRRRWAWFVLLSCLCIGVMIPILAIFDGRGIAPSGPLVPIVFSLFNTAIGTGIYFALKPAFENQPETDL